MAKREERFRNALGAMLDKLDAAEMREILRAVSIILYPDGNPDAEWSPDTLDRIAGILAAWGMCPNN